MAFFRAASLESMVSVRMKKDLDSSTKLDKWKGGNDGGCWPDGSFKKKHSKRATCAPLLELTCCAHFQS